jgi:NADP-dependent 3-hydroxy acid dehydrogenase YdfG
MGSEGADRILIEYGAKVATCGRQYDKLYALQLEYSQFMLHTMVCDVSHEDECKRFIHSTVETFGTIDILINNAGISMRSLFDEADTDVIRRLMDVNFMGAVYCTKAALPYIFKQKGTIMGISSQRVTGVYREEWLFSFKFALQGWLESHDRVMIQAFM